MKRDVDEFVLWFVIPLATSVAVAARISPWSWRRFFKRLTVGILVLLVALVLFVVVMFAFFPPDLSHLSPL